MQYGELLHNLFISLQSLYKGKLKHNEASFQQLIAISILDDDGVEMSKFSQKLGIDNSTATRLIDGIEKKGWVIRKRFSLDNRIIKVFLTDIGRDIYNVTESQIEKIGIIVGNETNGDFYESILESMSNLNWTIEKLKLK
ncbi:MAG: hypothetical protein CMG55_00915 [Candidatus Marinimicrobia bacterium]|nr:hypothetical protein [Candidatus Neomarinimicrobiota bacterium]|tara:strand:- start:831 stop:1250 length:420 start_codon:yes stop_codon:yes gene_type:complete